MTLVFVPAGTLEARLKRESKGNVCHLQFLFRGWKSIVCLGSPLALLVTNIRDCPVRLQEYCRAIFPTHRSWHLFLGQPWLVISSARVLGLPYDRPQGWLLGPHGAVELIQSLVAKAGAHMCWMWGSHSTAATMSLTYLHCRHLQCWHLGAAL